MSESKGRVKRTALFYRREIAQLDKLFVVLRKEIGAKTKSIHFIWNLGLVD